MLYLNWKPGNKLKNKSVQKPIWLFPTIFVTEAQRICFVDVLANGIHRNVNKKWLSLPIKANSKNQ